MLARWNELSLRLMAEMSVWKARLTSEKGQTMVEYGLILALIAIVVIVALQFMGKGLFNMFNNVANTINSAQ